MLKLNKETAVKLGTHVGAGVGGTILGTSLVKAGQGRFCLAASVAMITAGVLYQKDWAVTAGAGAMAGVALVGADVSASESMTAGVTDGIKIVVKGVATGAFVDKIAPSMMEKLNGFDSFDFVPTADLDKAFEQIQMESEKTNRFDTLKGLPITDRFLSLSA